MLIDEGKQRGGVRRKDSARGIIATEATLRVGGAVVDDDPVNLIFRTLLDIELE